VVPDPFAFGRALQAAGAPQQEGLPARATLYARARLAIRRGRLDQPWAKFVLLPLALALPAFRLHQHIAYGSGLGELYTFGLVAYLKGFALWWAAWMIGMVLCAAVLRALIEAATITAVLLYPAWSIPVRRWLESAALAVLYLGVPIWLLIRVLGP
jgi:apolipoprotein N-acyltransferase